MPTKKLASPKDVEAFFFRAMIHGYASSAEAIRNEDWRTSRPYQENNLLLIDTWNPEHGVGITQILSGAKLLWAMWYEGWYEINAIPTLKAALRSSYELGIFSGGRGPLSFRHNGYLYANTVDTNQFTGFMGWEAIHEDATGKQLGAHYYQGRWISG